MRKIIDGKRYDTTTAVEICDVSGSGGHLSRTDFKWEDTTLYRTPRGRFFVAGEGGPMSRWVVSCGNNSWTGGSGLMAIDECEARELVERFGSAETYEQTFGVAEAA